MSRVKITQFLIIITVLIQTCLGGLVDGENMVVAGIPLHDMTTIILFLYMIITYKEVKSRITPFNRLVLAYIVLVTLIIISMPFREKESLTDAFLAGRRYYILLIAFVIDDNIYYSGSKIFVTRVIYALGIYYSLIGILNYIDPHLINTYFPGLRNGFDDEKNVLNRNFISENIGLLFIHFSFVYKGVSIMVNQSERKFVDFFLLAFYLAGMFFIGLRAPLFSILLAFAFVYILYSKRLTDLHTFSGIKQIQYFLVAVLLVICVNDVFDNRPFNFVESVVNDVSGTSNTRGNTYTGRIKRALVYQIPQAMKQPIFGVGLIYKNTPAAKEHRYDRQSPNRVRDLYNMDFGYGTLWVTFGLLGAVIIIYCISRAVIEVFRQSSIALTEDYLQLMVILIAFLICNYTWAVFRDGCGLIIIAFSCSIANEAYLKFCNKFLTEIE